MLGLAAVVLRASPRLGLAMVAGAALSVAPVLVLPHAATQYGYGFALWLVACTALAWPRLGRAARALVLLLAVLVAWHGARVQSDMRAVGERQAVFQPALVAALAGHDGPLRLLRDRGVRLGLRAADACGAGVARDRRSGIGWCGWMRRRGRIIGWLTMGGSSCAEEHRD